MSLEGKRVLVTGANGGLGLATTIQLLGEGATVVLACRTDQKAENARRTALQEAGVSSERAIAAGGFDMLDPTSIATAVDALEAHPIDVVFLQAGGWVFTDDLQTVELGGTKVEKTVAQNVVGAHATLRMLATTARLAPRARVVIIGGEGARGVPGAIAKPAFTDPEAFGRYLAGQERPGQSYVPVDALGVAKLAAALWSQALARRTEGELEVVWFTPGLIAGTGGTRGMPAWKEFVFQRMAFPLLVWLGKAQWPEAAAAKCADCLAGRVGQHGDLLGAPGGTALGAVTDQKPLLKLFTQQAFQEVVWTLCEAAAGPILFRRQA